MARSTSRLAHTYLPSDPNFQLEYMADDSDDDFDGYLLSDDEPEGNYTFIIYIIIFGKTQ